MQLHYIDDLKCHVICKLIHNDIKWFDWFTMIENDNLEKFPSWFMNWFDTMCYIHNLRNKFACLISWSDVKWCRMIQNDLKLFKLMHNVRKWQRWLSVTQSIDLIPHWWDRLNEWFISDLNHFRRSWLISESLIWIDLWFEKQQQRPPFL